MFDPALEYRKFVQRARTEEQRKAKLTALAERWMARTGDCSVEEAIRRILYNYSVGYDILDPDFFDREDIQEFAERNGIERDPQVIAFIKRAQPRR